MMEETAEKEKKVFCCGINAKETTVVWKDEKVVF